VPTTNSIVLNNVWTVVVHHRSLLTLLTTIDSLRAAGIAPTRLVVIDNSEMPPNEEEALRASLPRGVNFLTTPNRGFAAAVNAGVTAIRHKDINVQYLLVATHEVILKENAIAVLVQALSEDGRRMAAGPTLLINGDSGERIWSRGGYLSQVLRLPRHRGYLEPSDVVESEVVTECEWLDGALVLYRWSEIALHEMDESFFLYFEEVDYHLSIRARGGQVVCVPGSMTYQSSNGMPLFYLARNLQIFHRKWGRAGLRTIAAVYVCSKGLARGSVGGAFKRSLLEIFSGYLAGRKVLKCSR
jgi:GT2 family glycosyltransferase